MNVVFSCGEMERGMPKRDVYVMFELLLAEKEGRVIQPSESGEERLASDDWKGTLRLEKRS